MASLLINFLEVCCDFLSVLFFVHSFHFFVALMGLHTNSDSRHILARASDASAIAEGLRALKSSITELTAALDRNVVMNARVLALHERKELESEMDSFKRLVLRVFGPKASLDILALCGRSLPSLRLSSIACLLIPFF